MSNEEIVAINDNPDGIFVNAPENTNEELSREVISLSVMQVTMIDCIEDVCRIGIPQVWQSTGNLYAFNLRRYRPTFSDPFQDFTVSSEGRFDTLVDPSATESVSAEEHDIVSYGWDDPDFLGMTSFRTQDSFERMVNQPFAYKMMSAYMEHNAHLSIPKITVWRRCNTQYLSSFSINPCPCQGQGKFFMMRTNCLRPSVSRESFIRAVNRVAELSVQFQYEEENEESACTAASQELFNHDDKHMKIGTKQETMVEKSHQLNDVVRIREYCVSYEILKPNDVDRHDDVLEWASWTSKEAYIRYMDQPFVKQLEHLAEKCCYQPQEVLFWKRSECGLF